MAIELPKDSEGREIPLDTVVLFNARGDAFNIVRWIYTTDFETWSESNTWRAIEESHRAFNPEMMYLTPPDSWEKLEEDLSEAGDARYYEACAYFHRDKNEGGCISCPGGEDGCDRIVMRDILDRIRKLRSED